MSGAISSVEACHTPENTLEQREKYGLFCSHPRPKLQNGETRLDIMLIKEAKNNAEGGDEEEAGDDAEEIEDDSEDSTANRVG
jgi:hypothetical protein